MKKALFLFTLTTGVLLSGAPAFAQNMATGPTVQIVYAKDGKEMSAPERIKIAKAALRKCTAKKSLYRFEGDAKPNRFSMRFRADKRSTICAERFPLLSTYVVKTGKNKKGTKLNFRGELVPSLSDPTIYEGLMIQQMAKPDQVAEFVLVVKNFKVSDSKK
jgi:hypothetical protein